MNTNCTFMEVVFFFSISFPLTHTFSIDLLTKETIIKSCKNDLSCCSEYLVVVGCQHNEGLTSLYAFCLLTGLTTGPIFYNAHQVVMQRSTKIASCSKVLKNVLWDFGERG